jgi:hypothetical protein
MSEPEPSLRHVPKLVEVTASGERLYRCQLCRRQGALDQLQQEECPERSGLLTWESEGGTATGDTEKDSRPPRKPGSDAE